MRDLRQSVVLVCFLSVLLFLTSGCGREPTAEERHVDELLRKARTAVARSRHHDGRRLLLSALNLDEQLGRAQAMAEESELLSETYVATGEFDSAFFFYKKAEDHYKSVGDRISARRVRLSDAFLHRWIGEERQAFDSYAEMLRIARVLGDVQGVEEIQWAVLPSCRKLNRRDQETSILTELINSSTASKDPAMQARVYYEWGLSHAERGEHEYAVENLLRAFTLADQSRDSLLAIFVLAKLGMVYYAQGKTSEAFQTYTDGLTRSDKPLWARELREEMLVRVGNIYLRNRQFTEAERFYRVALLSAIERGNRLREGYLFIQMGHCEVGKSPRSESAVKNYQLALDLFASTSYDPGTAYALTSLGVAAFQAGRPNDALKDLNSAVEHLGSSFLLPNESDIYDECENAFFDIHHTSPHDALIETMLLLGKYDEAFASAERKRGLEIASSLAEFSYDTGSAEINAAMSRFQHQKALHFGALRQLAHVLSTDAQNRFLLEQLKAAIGHYRRLVDQSADNVLALSSTLSPAVRVGTISPAEVQKTLSRGTLLIEPIPTSRSVYVFALSNDRSSVQIGAVEKPRLMSLLHDYNQLLYGRSLYPDSAELHTRALDQQVGDLASSLYDAFLRPVEGQLTGATTLIVVPPDPLVPFHTLRRRPARAGSPYLIQRYSVKYLPAAAMLTLPRGSANVSSGIVAIGHPGTTGWDVEYELRDIRAFSKDVRLYFGKQATLAAVQKEEGMVLHLAAEFHYDRKSPGNSYALFSDGQAANTTTAIQWGSFLSLYQFPTVLVSDLGDHNDIALSQPTLFSMNGNASVVLTSYPPRRKTKKYFGELFYTSLVSGVSAEGSYRQAMVGMAENSEYSAPHLWAPFFLWER